MPHELPKEKGWNLISSNSVARAYLPEYSLANPNVHQLLTPGQLPTPALPKRHSLIFLWEEFSQRDPTPIVNPLLNKIFIVGGKWGTHSYSTPPKNNRGTDSFWNRLLSLCWFVDNVMKIWQFFGKINDEYIWTCIVYRNWNVFYLTRWQKIANEGWFCRSNCKNKIYGILWLPQKIVTENTK